MSKTEERVAQTAPIVNWRRLFITLAIGAVPTIAFFLFDLWWLGTASLLVTLLVAGFAFSSTLYPIVFTLYAFFAIWWVSGSLLDEYLPLAWPLGPGMRSAVPVLAGLLVAVVMVVSFWFLILYITTEWILSVSESLDVPRWRAFKFVASRLFRLQQIYVIVENGAIVAENPEGMLAKLGGPGALVVRPGNAVVLEQGGRVTRIEGPGVYALKRFEFIKRPIGAKGIIDLRSQSVGDTAASVLTRDGIPLDIVVRTGFQIEPKDVTDRRPSSHFPGGEAHSRVLGEPEYPVYEATIRKATFNTSPNGWHSMFPGGPIAILRDIVATYRLDELFVVDPSGSGEPDPDRRTIKRIESLVLRTLDTSGSGVQFKTFDIREITMPADVRERMVKRWAIPVDLRLRLQEAETEREMLIQKSDGRARAMERLGEARARSWEDVIRMVRGLLGVLSSSGDDVVLRFVNVIQELTRSATQDESLTTRYIEAMEAVIQSEGPKSFFFNVPPPGGLTAYPEAGPPALLQQGGTMGSHVTMGSPGSQPSPENPNPGPEGQVDTSQGTSGAPGPP